MWAVWPSCRDPSSYSLNISNKHFGENMRYFFVLPLFLISSIASAQLQYCTGTIADLITRNSHEATYVKLLTPEGGTGYAKLGGVNGYNQFEEMQLSMLLSAMMASKPVTLELNTTDYEFTSCQDFQKGTPIRYVRIR